jgi:hypothetical protein
MVVEKVNYNVNWRAFKRGYSIFIPCLDVPNARKEIMAVLKRLKIKVITKVSIEDGIRGLRIWRT